MSPPKRRTGTQILRDAEAYCRTHGLRLTRGRRRVLEKLASTNGAVKAYDLLEDLTDPGTKAMPPTIYRALDFWVKHGFVHKVESLNAFYACGHPMENEGCEILICSRCGETIEVCSRELRDLFGDVARKHGYTLSKAAFEIHGVCAKCAAKG